MWNGGWNCVVAAVVFVIAVLVGSDGIVVVVAVVVVDVAVDAVAVVGWW